MRIKTEMFGCLLCCHLVKLLPLLLELYVHRQAGWIPVWLLSAPPPACGRLALLLRSLTAG